MGYIISWSGGKDSTATIIMALKMGLPIDAVIHARLWFDRARGIPAVRPDLYEWLYGYAVPSIESMGGNVVVEDAQNDYIQWFYRVREKSKIPDRNGKMCGFLIAGKCLMCGEKHRAVKRVQQSYRTSQILIGICSDESKRIDRMRALGQRSILVEEGLTQADARRISEEAGLLSPVYQEGHMRDGCWFCPNATTEQFARIKEKYPNLWMELQNLSKVENMVSQNFKYGQTFDEVDAKVDAYLKRPKQYRLIEEGEADAKNT